MKTLTHILALAIGFALCYLFLQPETVRSVQIVTNTKIDTLYRSQIDTVFITELILEERVDTVYYSEPYKADISVYSGRETLEYGYIDWRSETTGKMINFSMIPHLNIPTITNRIETVKTVTETRDLRGVYAGASVSDRIDYKLGASYVDRNWLFSYDYQPREKSHWLGIRKRVF